MGELESALDALEADDLHALGAATGLPYTVDEHHGGWLTVRNERDMTHEQEE